MTDSVDASSTMSTDTMTTSTMPMDTTASVRDSSMNQGTQTTPNQSNRANKGVQSTRTKTDSMK